MIDKYYFIIREKRTALKSHEITKNIPLEDKVTKPEDITITPDLTSFEPPSIEASFKTISVEEQWEFILEYINQINNFTIGLYNRSSNKQYGFYIGTTSEFW